jgi:hypothetical protein
MFTTREPPSIQEMAERLASRVTPNGAKAHFHTVPAEHARCPACHDRRTRSLRHCHMPAEPKARHPAPRDTGAYVPEMACSIDNDQNLTDGARRCARKIAEYVYRKNRVGREAFITVPYLVKALGRCRRTVQRYLRQLEREGYIDVHVLPSERTRMCLGLLVRLLPPMFPKHRRHKWPESAVNRGATGVSQINRQGYLIRPMKRSLWAFLCCEGVWRGYMKTLMPLPPFPTAQQRA